jgi:hypothetical protein
MHRGDAAHTGERDELERSRPAPELDPTDKTTLRQEGRRGATSRRATTTRCSFGMKIASGQLDRLRRMYEMADEHGDDWAERRAQLAD